MKRVGERLVWLGGVYPGVYPGVLNLGGLNLGGANLGGDERVVDSGRVDVPLPAFWQRTDQRPLVVPPDRTVATSCQNGDASCQGYHESDQLDS